MSKQVSEGVSHIIQNTKYPDWLRNHLVFKKLNKITKVFPGIGLPNMTEPCVFDNLATAKQDGQNLIYYGIRNAIDNARYDIHATAASAGFQRLLGDVVTHIGANYRNMAIEEEGRVALRFCNDCGVGEDGKPVFKKGESVTKAYTKLIEKAKTFNYNLLALEKMDYFKLFSASNVPKKEYSICFSSDGELGAWDIATISMRGITSCQAWASIQSRGLIGSISSKYVGVIYITTGEKLDYGSKMMRRSLVRFCINKTTKKPALLIDRAYPSDDAQTHNVFREFLQRYTKLPIIFAGEPDWSKYILPRDNFWVETKFLPGEHTYMDTKIPYKELEPTVDVASYQRRIGQLDRELLDKVHKTLIKKIDEYSVDRKVHRDTFKGGLANFIVSLRKHIGGQEWWMCFGVPRLYNVTTAVPPQHNMPTCQQYSTAIEYEKAVIKTAIKNIKKLREETLKTIQTSGGKWVRFYPNSLKKFVSLIYQEYAKELLLSYQKLLISQKK